MVDLRIKKGSRLVIPLWLFLTEVVQQLKMQQAIFSQELSIKKERSKDKGYRYLPTETFTLANMNQEDLKDMDNTIGKMDLITEVSSCQE